MTDSTSSIHERWARLRFAVVGPLLSSPPRAGELRARLKELSCQSWQHPTRPGETICFTVTTIERWYYAARNSNDPIEALRRAVRRDAGDFKALSEPMRAAVENLHRQHPHWSYQLLHANLTAWAKRDPSLGRVPSYPTLVRFMRSRGLRRAPRRGNQHRPGLEVARRRFDQREVRSYEVEHPGGLWHLDFHTSRHIGVMLPSGRWTRPHLLAILDDHSRVCCHGQFFVSETADVLVHGFCQALMKRGLPRAVLSDNGGAMNAAEFIQGLERLSILQHMTLPYSPYQNGKQEHFFAVVESRFLAMLDTVRDLTIETLNTMLQAWIEGDYHRSVHSETGQTPIERLLRGNDVHREARDAKSLRDAFRQHATRTVRRSDTTVTVEGVRFEIPSAYRHLERVRVAYARWDLGHVHLVDPRTGKDLVRIWPLDRQRNASGFRRPVAPVARDRALEPPADGQPDLPPYLKQLVEEYAASGAPPGYLAGPRTEHEEATEEEEGESAA